LTGWRARWGRAREIERVNARLEHELHRAPTDAEMAEALEISVDTSRTRSCNLELLGGRAVSGARSRALGRPGLAARHHPGPRRARPGARPRLVRDERACLGRESLPEREKLVVSLDYYENLTLCEIGEVFGVTESRVSQLHTKAIPARVSRLGDDAVEEAV
jgi:RNA polymerase sigma factor FliA